MRLYGKFFMIHIKSIMEYKTSFFLSCLGQFLVSFNLFLGIHFMFRRFSRVEGFTYSEVLLCCGITLLEFSLAEAFARGFDTFGSIVRYGEFDRILVRPRNEIFQVLASRIELSRIGRILQAIVMFVYGIRASHVHWNLQKAAAVILMLFGGAVVFSGFLRKKDAADLYLRGSLCPDPVLSAPLPVRPGEARLRPAASGGLPVHDSLSCAVESGG